MLNFTSLVLAEEYCNIGTLDLYETEETNMYNPYFADT